MVRLGLWLLEVNTAERKNLSLHFMSVGNLVHVNLVLFMLLLRCPSPGQGLFRPVPMSFWHVPSFWVFVCFLTFWHYMMLKLTDFSCPSPQIKSKGLCFLSLQNGIKIWDLGVLFVTGVWLLLYHSVGRAGRERVCVYMCAHLLNVV